MTEKQHALLDPTKIRQCVMRTRDFAERMPNVSTHEGMGRLIGQLAGKLVDRSERLSRCDALSLQLYEQALPFVDAQRDLSASRDLLWLTRDEKLDCLNSVIAFNHTVKEVYNDNPTLPLSAVPDFVAKVVLEFAGPKRARTAILDTKRVMTGMRTELAWEAIAWQIDGVEDIVSATAEDELQHIDYTVLYRGQRVTVDVKASDRGVTDAIGKGNQNAVLCPVAADEFGSRFTLTWDEASDPRYQDRVRKDLDTQLARQHGVSVA